MKIRIFVNKDREEFYRFLGIKIYLFKLEHRSNEKVVQINDLRDKQSKTIISSLEQVKRDSYMVKEISINLSDMNDNRAQISVMFVSLIRKLVYELFV